MRVVLSNKNIVSKIPFPFYLVCKRSEREGERECFLQYNPIKRCRGMNEKETVETRGYRFLLTTMLP